MTTVANEAETTQVNVPDIGDFAEIAVIEVHVSTGDVVAEDDPLITLESDKAAMDIPAPRAGTVDSLAVSIGDHVSEGSPILTLSVPASGADEAPAESAEPRHSTVGQQEPDPRGADAVVEAARSSAAQAEPAEPETRQPASGVSSPDGAPHAGPSVRRLARELEVDLTTVTGSGPKGRITKEDLRRSLAGPSAAAAPATSGAGIPPVPVPDFAAYGPVHTEPLPRIKTISGAHLHRSWLNVPHVTHDDEADITRLDAYRRELDAQAKQEGYRVTLLAFLLKAAVAALSEYPEVNSSLSADKASLVYKDYYHLGVAVDTPGGLVVPVLRDVDRKGITTLSRELGEVSAKARAGKLAPGDMQGGTFTISSLGGIGGTSFTPVVNAPEVAILGVVRARTMPVWNGKRFRPRLMLPLSLSYDHRVVDGALAARFVRHLCASLEDMRRLLL